MDLIGKTVTTLSGTRYLLSEMVGRGSQGIVYRDSSGGYVIKIYFYKGDNQAKNQIVKLKWLLQQNLPERFVFPMEIIEKPYIGYVMRRVKGHFPLNKLLIKPKGMGFLEWYNEYSGGLRRRLLLGYQIAQSFGMLHKQSLAYCDISGANILVAEDKSTVSVVMVDCDNLYLSGTGSPDVLGTEEYTAPEVATHQMWPGVVTDQYSLAVILFELLRIDHPYVGDKIWEDTPEKEKEAWLGVFPYIDDENNPSNKSSGPLSANLVFTTQLMTLFKKTFIQSKNNRMLRPGTSEFARACLEASNLLVKCEYCKAWYYHRTNIVACPWCHGNIQNQKPMYLSFRDRMEIGEKDGKKNPQTLDLHSYYILRESPNDITSNYILRDTSVDETFFKLYCRVEFVKDTKKYRLINPSNNSIVYKIFRTQETRTLTSDSPPQELERSDEIYFGDPSTFIDNNTGSRSRILRSAVVK